MGNLGSVLLPFIFYSAKDLRDNTKGITDDLENGLYSSPTTIPPMPWLQSAETEAPQEVWSEGSVLFWSKVPSVRKWNLYQQKGGSLVLLKVLHRDEVSLEVPPGLYAIAGVSRASVESERVFIRVAGRMREG